MSASYVIIRVLILLSFKNYTFMINKYKPACIRNKKKLGYYTTVMYTLNICYKLQRYFYE